MPFTVPISPSMGATPAMSESQLSRAWSLIVSSSIISSRDFSMASKEAFSLGRPAATMLVK